MGLGIDPQTVILLLVALLVSLTFHEASHALMAFALGDTTAQKLGRLSLNPIRHLDPLGTIFLAVMAFSGTGIGWAKPVPVDPRTLRIGPKAGMAVVALAGPVANMALAAGIYAMARTVEITDGSIVGDLMVALFIVNVSLAAFNLIPIPPLDGFSVLLGILPNGPAYTLNRVRQYGPAVLLLMIVFPQALVRVLEPLRSAVFTLVTFGNVH